MTVTTDTRKTGLYDAAPVSDLQEAAYLTLAEPANLASGDLQVSAAASVNLSLPNPYPSQANAPIHPSVLFFPAGWNGYHYWMAYTPYPDYSNIYENPTIAASNDAVNWYAQGRQPLVDYPGGNTYNADTHLFMSSDDGTMYLAFIERGPAGFDNTVKVMHTTNGVSWSTPAAILTGAVGTQAFASPSIWWNGAGWTMTSHNVDAASPWPVERRVSSTSDVYGAWGAASTVTITPAAGRAWWHSFCLRLSSGQIVALFQDNDGTSGTGGNNYWCESADDGVTFTVGERVFVNETTINSYRSTFCSYLLGSTLVSEVFHSNFASLTIARRVLHGGKKSAQRAFWAGQAALLAVSKAPNALWSDTFTRADSAASLGTADSGGAYTASSGTWGISSNRAYPVATGRVLASAGVADHEVSCRFTNMTGAGQSWLICRAVDGNNYWRIGTASVADSGQSGLTVQSIVGGAVSVSVSGGVFSPGDTITLRASGSILTVFVNGVRVYELMMTTSLTGLSFGMQASVGANTFMDNLTCIAV